jgi:hypothetical protein
MLFPKRALSTLTLVCAALVAGCTSTSPGDEIAGNWSGVITSNVAGNGTIRLSLLQSGSKLTGTWATSFPNAAADNSGSLIGNVTDSQIGATLNPSVPTACPSTVAGSVNGTMITGTYAAFNCSAVSSGGFSVTKD